MLKQFSKTRLSRRSAGFIKAFRDPPLAPATVLCFSFIGFGVLCRGADIGLAPSVYTTVFIFALPAQVVLVDQIAREIPLWTAALAVAFTGVRLLPMTVSLIPYLRAGRGPRFIDYFVAHFVAVTMWIESMRRIPFLPRGMRLPYYFGLAIILVGVSLAGTVAGYLIAINSRSPSPPRSFSSPPPTFFSACLGTAAEARITRRSCWAFAWSLLRRRSLPASISC